MKNYEKYAEEIREYSGFNFCENFVIPHIIKTKDNCEGRSCIPCQMQQMMWLFEECEESEEPKTDWSKVEVDTPILVRDAEYEAWNRRYFAEYKDGIVYAWGGGNTSWTAYDDMNCWKYAKLAESEEGGAR